MFHFVIYIEIPTDAFHLDDEFWNMAWLYGGYVFTLYECFQFYDAK